jgi:hypothetical protein
MRRQQLIYLISVVGVLAGLLFSMTFYYNTRLAASQTFDYNDIKGMAIERNGTLYTLNFEQQNEVAAQLNRSKLLAAPLIDVSDHSWQQPSFSRLVIYGFNILEVEVVPLGYVDGNMLFTSPVWAPGSQHLDISQGTLRNLLESICR